MQKTRWNTKTLTFLALMIALQIVLGDLFSITLSATNKVSLGPVVTILSGLWLGPVAGTICGLTADVIGYFMSAQAFPFNPLITLATGVWGLVPGLVSLMMTNKTKTKKIVLIVVSVIVSSILGTFILTTLGLMIFSGLSFGKIYWTRLLQMAVGIPVYSIISTLIYFSPITKLIMDAKFSIKNKK